jgi:hypothetical protein
MSSLITLIRSLFSEKSKTSSKLVENTSNEEVLAITHTNVSYEITDIRHPLNPLRFKCDSGFGTAVLCLTY